MSFYNRSYGGLVRFPGLGGFGGVEEAQDALNAAQAKVRSLETKVASQKKLVAYTHLSIKQCTEGGIQIVGNFMSGGITAAACLVDQNNQLGQRNGLLVQFEADLDAAKAELANARAALTQAREAAASAPPESTYPTAGTPSGGGSGGSGGSGYTSSSMKKGGLLSNPLVLGGGAVVLLGVILLLTRKKSSSVAGYRRRNRR
jgi:hypothetical protein